MGKYNTARHTLQGTWDQVRQALTEIQTSDTQAEAKVSSGTQMSCGGCMATFAGIFSMGFLGPLGLVILIPGLICLIYGLVKTSMNQSYDLENMRYQVPLALLDTVGADLDPSRPVNLTIDFRASQSQQFIQKVEQSSFLIFKTGPKVSYFSHPWLEMTATTCDGYRIKLSITREGTLKAVPKRKRTKTKLRYLDAVSVAVRPPSGQTPTPATGTPLLAPAAHRFQRFQGQITAQGAVARASGPHYTTVSNRTTSHYGEQLAGNDLVTLLVACFRGLHNTTS